MPSVGCAGGGPKREPLISIVCCQSKFGATWLLSPLGFEMAHRECVRAAGDERQRDRGGE